MTETISPAQSARRSPWNSLEIVKLCAQVATPVILAFLVAQLAGIDKERSENVTRYERVVDKRIELWDELAPKLNDIYAYLLYVGHWKDLSAADIVARKRECDKLVYSYRPFFSEEFLEKYTEFMDASFQTYNAMGRDAMPMTTSEFRNSTDQAGVSGTENSDAVHLAYYSLLGTVASDFNLVVRKPGKRPLIPAEILARDNS